MRKIITYYHLEFIKIKFPYSNPISSMAKDRIRELIINIVFLPGVIPWKFLSAGKSYPIGLFHLSHTIA